MKNVPELVIKNIGLLATPLGNEARGGQEQGDILLLPNAYLAISGSGEIMDIGKEDEIKQGYLKQAAVVKDAQGSLVTPGLVDAHTHLVFGGWRQKELALKLKGYSYLDILKQGGGILNTVRNTRRATREELAEKARASLDIMQTHGTTTCEVKSGYGLSLEDEVKSLEVVRELQKTQPVDLVATFMGAHAVPEEFKTDKNAYIRLVCEVMIPRIAGEGLAEFCDIFCEDSVFNIEESRTILECGLKFGLKPKIHADEITSLGGAKLAAEVGALSAEHLIHAMDDGLKAMAAKRTIAVLLPGTSLYLGEDFAPAAKMKELGIPIAVATDFNPGSNPTESLQLPMNLASLKYRLSPEEALTAVTLNAAAAINRAGLLGTLEKGKQADLVIWNASDLDFLFYHYGVNLVNTVVKKGRILIERKRIRI